MRLCRPRRALSTSGVDDAGADVAALQRMKTRKAFYLFGLLVIPSVFIMVAAFSLMNWPVPTRVQIDLVVDRVAFSLAGTQPVPILDNAVGFHTLSIESFESITFKPAKL